MPYRAGDITRLIQDLAATDEVRREAAIARLTIIGSGVVGPLVEALRTQSSSGPDARRAAVRVLETMDDPRIAPAVLPLLDDPDDVVLGTVAAILRCELRSSKGSPRVLETVTAAALDPARPPRTRVAALEALQDLPPRVRGPLVSKLASSADPLIRHWSSTERGARDPIDAAALVERASRGPLSDSAEDLKRAIARSGDEVPLATLQRLVDVLRAREREERGQSTEREWMTARASAHLVLARRHSRIALYDLRETVERTGGPLPVEFLAALGAVGDESCLEPIAAGYARSPATEEWWRRHLEAAFAGIVRRRRVTRRHPILKRIAVRWPAAAAALLPARSTRTK